MEFDSPEMSVDSRVGGTCSAMKLSGIGYIKHEFKNDS